MPRPPSDPDAPLATALRRWMDGRSESYVARAAGVPLSTLRAYLDGRYSPRADHLGRIARACGRTQRDVGAAVALAAGREP